MSFVYLIEEVPHPDGDSGPWTKIGYSQNPPAWRMNNNLRFGNPRTIRLVAVYRAESNGAAWELEQKAHAHFAADAYQKEWFSVPWQTVNAWFNELGFASIPEKEWSWRPKIVPQSETPQEPSELAT